MLSILDEATMHGLSGLVKYRHKFSTFQQSLEALDPLSTT
jgi:hypothetical protein